MEIFNANAILVAILIFASFSILIGEGDCDWEVEGDWEVNRYAQAYAPIDITANITSNLNGAWILLDSINTSKKVPSIVYIRKSGKHNITLISNNIFISQFVVINESLVKIRLDLNGSKPALSLEYDKK
jgi:hypothetical protein